MVVVLFGAALAPNRGVSDVVRLRGPMAFRPESEAPRLGWVGHLQAMAHLAETGEGS
jgi:hypothetical protein